MTRFNVLLLAAVMLCALATVNSTHRARLLIASLENEQTLQKQIDVEWGQLQLEQSTWAKHALVESIATRQLGMRAPDSHHLTFITPASATHATSPAAADSAKAPQ
jgi:cell division protein FtsL